MAAAASTSGVNTVEVVTPAETSWDFSDEDEYGIVVARCHHRRMVTNDCSNEGARVDALPIVSDHSAPSTALASQQRRSKHDQTPGDSETAVVQASVACFKTKLCRFHLAGRCAKQEECTFAHDVSELNPVPDLYKTRLCDKWILKQQCIESCPFAHGEKELRDCPPLPEKHKSISCQLKDGPDDNSKFQPPSPTSRSWIDPSPVSKDENVEREYLQISQPSSFALCRDVVAVDEIEDNGCISKAPGRRLKTRSRRRRFRSERSMSPAQTPRNPHLPRRLHFSQAIHPDAECAPTPLPSASHETKRRHHVKDNRENSGNLFSPEHSSVASSCSQRHSHVDGALPVGVFGFKERRERKGALPSLTSLQSTVDCTPPSHPYSYPLPESANHSSGRPLVCECQMQRYPHCYATVGARCEARWPFSLLPFQFFSFPQGDAPSGIRGCEITGQKGHTYPRQCIAASCPATSPDTWLAGYTQHHIGQVPHYFHHSSNLTMPCYGPRSSFSSPCLQHSCPSSSSPEVSRLPGQYCCAQHPPSASTLSYSMDAQTFRQHSPFRPVIPEASSLYYEREAALQSLNSYEE